MFVFYQPKVYYTTEIVLGNEIAKLLIFTQRDSKKVAMDVRNVYQNSHKVDIIQNLCLGQDYFLTAFIILR